MGVHIGETYTDYSTGSFKVTDNSTDFAIKGDGFFAIAYTDKQGNSSVKYTRDGAFTVNTQGYLVTKDGGCRQVRAGNPGVVQCECCFRDGQYDYDFQSVSGRTESH